MKSIKIIPLDVTNRCFITENDLLLLKSKNKKAQFMREAVTNWYRFFGFPKKRVFELYDPLAISALKPDYIDFQDFRIGINLSGLKQGEVFINGKYKVKIAISAKNDSFKKFLMQMLDK